MPTLNLKYRSDVFMDQDGIRFKMEYRLGIFVDCCRLYSCEECMFSDARELLMRDI